MPLISIIVPVYNVEEYLDTCLDSLVEQDVGIDHLEILIIDDCSPDNSIVIADKYANAYKNAIRVIRHEKNKGPGGARNTGLEHATGKYIAFVDSDDFLDTNVFSLATEIMEQDNAIDIFLYAYEYYSKSNKQYPLNPSGKLFPLNRTISQYEIVQYPELMHATSVWNKVYRRTLFKLLPKFPSGHFEDAVFSIKGYLEAKKIHITDRTSYFYRKREVEENPSIMDNYLDRKENYFDHLAVNEQLYNLSKSYPHMTYAINWFNTRSWYGFVNNIFNHKVDLNDKEKEELFQRTKKIWENIDIDNLYHDGINNATKKLITVVQTAPSFSEAEEKLIPTQKKPISPPKELSQVKSIFKTVIPASSWQFLQKMKHKIFIEYPNKIANPPQGKTLPLEIQVSPQEAAVKQELEYLKNLDEYKKMPNDIWLFSERGNEAKDNAFALFKFVRQNHPSIPAYFIMTETDSDEYLKAAQLGNVINKNSNQHKIAFLKSKYLLCTHTRGMISPWQLNILSLCYEDYLKKKYIFLQHGITHNNVSEALHKTKQNFDLFLCGAKPEYDYILNHFGYSPKEVKYTGFARYDSLLDFTTKNQILLMTTWRTGICQPSWHSKRTVNDSKFITSEYYKKYQELINSEQLIAMLENNNLELIFYPHFEMQQYLKYFSTPSDKIIIASKDNYDVQTLLIESKLLITDYSSVFFDFAYMKKPCLFYQFDEKIFFDTHYKRGYFNYKTDGFGIVCNYKERLLAEIEKVIDSDFVLNQKYYKRIKKFFPLHDKNNCLRIYREIISLGDDYET